MRNTNITQKISTEDTISVNPDPTNLNQVIDLEESILPFLESLNKKELSLPLKEKYFIIVFGFIIGSTGFSFGWNLTIFNTFGKQFIKQIFEINNEEEIFSF